MGEVRGTTLPRTRATRGRKEGPESLIASAQAALGRILGAPGAYREQKEESRGEHGSAHALQRHVGEFMGLGEHVGPTGVARMERDGDDAPAIVRHGKIVVLSHLCTTTGVPV